MTNSTVKPLSAAVQHPLSHGSSSRGSVSISILVNEMLVYIRSVHQERRIDLESPFSDSPKASLIRVISRIRDIVTAGHSSSVEQRRWMQMWNEEDSAVYRAMVKALEKMVMNRRGEVPDAHLIAVLKARCPRTGRRTGAN